MAASYTLFDSHTQALILTQRDPVHPSVMLRAPFCIRPPGRNPL
jgi:hypothetical protein